MRTLNDRARMVFSFDAIGFILGLGYVMGLRSSMILCAGGVLSNFVLVPLIWFIGSHIDSAVYPATMPISHMTAVQIYRNYVRFIGVGAIATAGIFGIIKSLRVVAGSFGIALRVFRHGEARCAGAHRPRHSDDRDFARRGRRRDWRGRLLRAACRCSWTVVGIGTGADAGVLLLLHLGGGQCDRHHRAQSGVRA